MRQCIAVFLVILPVSVVIAQDYNDKITFILPKGADSVVNSLFIHLEEYGLEDSILVDWTLRYGSPNQSAYSFYRIHGNPEYDTIRNLYNDELWFKNRTNRFLIVNKKFLVPMIFFMDRWTSAGKDEYPFSSPDLGTEYSLWVRFATNGTGFLYKNWKLYKAEDGKSNIEISKSVMDSVFLGW